MLTPCTLLGEGCKRFICIVYHCCCFLILHHIQTMKLCHFLLSAWSIYISCSTMEPIWALKYLKMWLASCIEHLIFFYHTQGRWHSSIFCCVTYARTIQLGDKLPRKSPMPKFVYWCFTKTCKIPRFLLPIQTQWQMPRGSVRK